MRRTGTYRHCWNDGFAATSVAGAEHHRADAREAAQAVDAERVERALPRVGHLARSATTPFVLLTSAS